MKGRFHPSTNDHDNLPPGHPIESNKINGHASNIGEHAWHVRHHKLYGQGVVWMRCGGATPYDLPERESARRASVVGKAGRCQRCPASTEDTPLPCSQDRTSCCPGSLTTHIFSLPTNQGEILNGFVGINAGHPTPTESSIGVEIKQYDIQARSA